MSTTFIEEVRIVGWGHIVPVENPESTLEGDATAIAQP